MFYMAGRPKKRASARKTETVNIRVTAEQKRELAAAADHAGLGVSSWMLSVALGAARKEGAGRT
jgi:uncharacterized protein (DUF1778 family)